jgi:hypothetical protein
MTLPPCYGFTGLLLLRQINGSGSAFVRQVTLEVVAAMATFHARRAKSLASVRKLPAAGNAMAHRKDSSAAKCLRN